MHVGKGVFVFPALLMVILLGMQMFIGCTTISPQKAKSLEAESEPEKPIDLIFAYWPPQDADICRLGFEAWGHEIEEATDGRVRVNFFGGSAMGAPNDHYKLAVTGTADISNFVPEFTPGDFPLSSIANLPMLFPSSEAAALALYRFHMKYTADTELKELKILAVSPTAPAQLLTRTKQVRNLDDLEGMKIVTTSKIQARLIDLLGATPVFMTDRELYTSLARGLTDGRFTEWHGAMVWEVMKATKYRTANIDLSLNQMLIVMNWNCWYNLPADIQQVITGATGLLLSRHLGMVLDRANYRNLVMLQEYDREMGNPEIYWLDDAERQRWAEAVQPFTERWIAETEAAGYTAAAALEDMKDWLDEYRPIYEPTLIPPFN